MATADRIAVADVIAELGRRFGEARYSDVLDRLRGRGLVPPSRWLGHGKGNDYAAAQAEHIYQVFALREQLGPDWTYPLLAFTMAARGVKPKFCDERQYAELVAQYITEGVTTFLEGSEDLVGHIAGGRTGGSRSTPPEVLKARRMTADLFKSQGLARTQNTETLFRQAELIAEIILGVWLFGKPVSNYAAQIRELSYMMVEDPAQGDALRQAVDALLRTYMPLMQAAGEQNPLISAVRKALHKDHSILLRAPKDAVHLYRAIRDGLSDIPDADVQFRRKDEQILKRVGSSLGALLAAFSVRLQLNNSQHPGLLALRRGEMGAQFRQQINSLLAISHDRDT